jgi:hypothetical protein
MLVEHRCRSGLQIDNDAFLPGGAQIQRGSLQWARPPSARWWGAASSPTHRSATAGGDRRQPQGGDRRRPQGEDRRRHRSKVAYASLVVAAAERKGKTTELQ